MAEKKEFDLAKQLEALRKKGESLGLSDEEIDTCIMKAIGGKLSHQIPSFTQGPCTINEKPCVPLNTEANNVSIF